MATADVPVHGNARPGELGKPRKDGGLPNPVKPYGLGDNVLEVSLMFLAEPAT